MEEPMNPQLRSMLRGYEQQLLSARRLARLRVKMRLAEGEPPHDPDPEIKRRAYVEKVARELYESLIYTGSDNPMVEEIRRELGKSVGQELLFTYPPGEQLRFVGRGPQGSQPLSEDAQKQTRFALWRITRQLVHQSMLDKPPPLGSR